MTSQPKVKPNQRLIEYPNQEFIIADGNLYSFSTSIAHLLSVVNQISQWMSSHLLCLNPSKTEFIIIGLPAQIKKIPDSSIRLSNNSSSTTFISDAPVRNLGVTFDP